MSDQYAKARFPWTTVSPSALSALDLGNVSAIDFRPSNWWGRPDQIFEQSVENDFALLALLDQAVDGGVEHFDLSQPVAKWRVGRPADLWTTNDAAIAAADTYLSLADSLIIETGHLLHFIDYNVTYRVLDVDDDNSEGWTNGASDAANVQVERLSGPSVAIPSGTICHAGSPIMGEEGTPSKGLTSTPGDPVFNTMQLVGIYGSITRVQDESEMLGGWGTHPKIRDDVFFQHRFRKQFDMLFGNRFYGTDTQAVQGQLWVSAGIVQQIKTHVLNAGSLGVDLTGPNLNDFWESTFDSDLSSAVKDHFCGSAQFRDVRKTGAQGAFDIEMLGIQSGAVNPMSLGANSMKVTLQSGKSVMVHELRKALSSANLSDWGITLDRGNLGIGTYNNISEAWFEDIENPAQAITVRSDALIDTWMPCVKDESTCAVIRGGARALIER